MFRLETLEDFQKFDEFVCRSTFGDRSGSPVYETFMADAYLLLKDRENSAKLLAALMDLRLTYAFLNQETDIVHGNWNSIALIVRGKNSDQLPNTLEHFPLFETKFKMLKSAISVIVTARSFWDKYLGFLTLLYDPDNYEKYNGASSRKKTFRKFVTEWEDLPKGLQHSFVLGFQNDPAIYRHFVDLFYEDKFFPYPAVDILMGRIEALDKFRTPEVHSDGRLRKHALALLPFEETLETIVTGNAWNHLNDAMNSLRHEFCGAPLINLKETPIYLGVE